MTHFDKSLIYEKCVYLVVTHRPYSRNSGLFRDLAFKVHTLGYQYEVSNFIMTNFEEGNRGGIQFPQNPCPNKAFTSGNKFNIISRFHSKQYGLL